MSHVVITIVTWNSMRYLPEALASIEAQTFRDWSLLIIDNASSDGVAEFVRANHPKAMIIRNTQNLGFCRAHNQGIAYAKAQLAREGVELFVLVTNPDVILEPDYLETLLDSVERRPEVGSAVGKLLKIRERGEGALREGERTSVIDSTGIKICKNRRLVERGAGESDEEGRFGKTEEIFGVSGALALYRLAALEDIAVKNEYFDEDFFVYKEDIDVAWRLRLRGWAALYVPRAKAYHYRAAYGRDRASFLEVIRGRRGRSRVVNYFSYRNHLLLLLKDEQLANGLLDMPRIAWYELRKFLYVLFAEPSTLRAIPSYLALLPKMLGKRRAIMRGARVKAKDVRKWFA
ncbi:MAG: hypothetical protein RL272_172 [Candidatus Parcubacteria bacterium]